jgi:hypothetical protein
VLLTTNYCLWIAASAAEELAPIANSTSGIQSRAVARVNVAPIIREIKSTTQCSRCRYCGAGQFNLEVRLR